MRIPVGSGRFKRDVKRMIRRRADMDKLKAAIQLLAEAASLPLSCRDHSLSGNWHGFRDLHIEPDWLLIYRVDGDEVQLARTGTHSDIFDQ